MPASSRTGSRSRSRTRPRRSRGVHPARRGGPIKWDFTSPRLITRGVTAPVALDGHSFDGRNLGDLCITAASESLSPEPSARESRTRAGFPRARASGAPPARVRWLRACGSPAYIQGASRPRGRRCRTSSLICRGGKRGRPRRELQLVTRPTGSSTTASRRPSGARRCRAPPLPLTLLVRDAPTQRSSHPGPISLGPRRRSRPRPRCGMPSRTTAAGAGPLVIVTRHGPGTCGPRALYVPGP
jgi:hypothetical protein